MAGVVFKDPKNKHTPPKQYSPEYQSDTATNKQITPVTSTESRPKFSLSGILGLNQTVELHQPNNQPKEKVFFHNHLVEEQKVLFDTHQKELQKEIEAIHQEIKDLLKQTAKLDDQIENAVLQPITEVNTYQVTFLKRLHALIASFRRNVAEAGCWLDVLKKRKTKKNAFWGSVKNKKSGGEQYLFSNEHSAARSAN